MAEDGDDDRQKGVSEGLGISKRAASEILLPEILAAAKQEGAKVDVNVLLIQLSQKSQTPDELVLNSERVLDLARKFEDHRLESFKKMADAVIAVKNSDPDELEKRRNNGMRRRLKGVIATCVVASLASCIWVATMSGNVVLASLLGGVGMMGLGALVPLASGESVSSNDVVRMFAAMSSFLRPKADPEPEKRDERRKRK
jgi:hypothetical protein